MARLRLRIGRAREPRASWPRCRTRAPRRCRRSRRARTAAPAPRRSSRACWSPAHRRSAARTSAMPESAARPRAGRVRRLAPAAAGRARPAARRMARRTARRSGTARCLAPHARAHPAAGPRSGIALLGQRVVGERAGARAPGGRDLAQRRPRPARVLPRDTARPGRRPTARRPEKPARPPQGDRRRPGAARAPPPPAAPATPRPAPCPAGQAGEAVEGDVQRGRPARPQRHGRGLTVGDRPRPGRRRRHRRSAPGRAAGRAPASHPPGRLRPAGNRW